MVSHGGGFLARMLSPDVPLAWLSDADLDFYTGEFARTGFRGSLNWFRNLDRNWELLAPFAGAKVTVPALYMAGDRDLVVPFRNMDKSHRQFGGSRAAAARRDNAARLRALDPAGACCGGQCRDDRLPPPIVGKSARLFDRAVGACPMDERQDGTCARF